MRVLKDLPHKINGVEVVRDLGMNDQQPRKRIAEFRCECGQLFVARINAVSVGHRRSCGCLIEKPSVYTHLLSKHPLYRKWTGMITRVTNDKENRWHRYGGRGITICDEWRNDFMAFYNWALDNGYKAGLTIDRIDNDGNYEPTNCQWITMKENITKDRHSEFIKNNKAEYICDEYKKGYKTVSKIAQELGTYNKVVSSILKDNNIKLTHRRLKKCLIK